ncbi:MAG: hypothetical protein Q7T11_07215, partial [Deltaproteobacteria bacterium]|nr:hypothetical protein [Deltaproteobacteria bacterium]
LRYLGVGKEAAVKLVLHERARQSLIQMVQEGTDHLQALPQETLGNFSDQVKTSLEAEIREYEEMRGKNLAANTDLIPAGEQKEANILLQGYVTDTVKLLKMKKELFGSVLGYLQRNYPVKDLLGFKRVPMIFVDRLAGVKLDIPLFAGKSGDDYVVVDLTYGANYPGETLAEALEAFVSEVNYFGDGFYRYITPGGKEATRRTMDKAIDLASQWSVIGFAHAYADSSVNAWGTGAKGFARTILASEATGLAAISVSLWAVPAIAGAVGGTAVVAAFATPFIAGAITMTGVASGLLYFGHYVANMAESQLVGEKINTLDVLGAATGALGAASTLAGATLNTAGELGRQVQIALLGTNIGADISEVIELAKQGFTHTEGSLPEKLKAAFWYAGLKGLLNLVAHSHIGHHLDEIAGAKGPSHVKPHDLKPAVIPEHPAREIPKWIPERVKDVAKIVLSVAAVSLAIGAKAAKVAKKKTPRPENEHQEAPAVEATPQPGTPSEPVVAAPESDPTDPVLSAPGPSEPSGQQEPAGGLDTASDWPDDSTPENTQPASDDGPGGTVPDTEAPSTGGSVPADDPNAIDPENAVMGTALISNSEDDGNGDYSYSSDIYDQNGDYAGSMDTSCSGGQCQDTNPITGEVVTTYADNAGSAPGDGEVRDIVLGSGCNGDSDCESGGSCSSGICVENDDQGDQGDGGGSGQPAETGLGSTDPSAPHRSNAEYGSGNWGDYQFCDDSGGSGCGWAYIQAEMHEMIMAAGFVMDRMRRSWFRVGGGSGVSDKCDALVEMSMDQRRMACALNSDCALCQTVPPAPPGSGGSGNSGSGGTGPAPEEEDCPPENIVDELATVCTVYHGIDAAHCMPNIPIRTACGETTITDNEPIFWRPDARCAYRANGSTIICVPAWVYDRGTLPANWLSGLCAAQGEGRQTATIGGTQNLPTGWEIIETRGEAPHITWVRLRGGEYFQDCTVDAATKVLACESISCGWPANETGFCGAPLDNSVNGSIFVELDVKPSLCPAPAEAEPSTGTPPPTVHKLRVKP